MNIIYSNCNDRPLTKTINSVGVVFVIESHAGADGSSENNVNEI